MLTHIRAFTADDLQASDVASELTRLGESFADEGHFSYLRALTAEATERPGLLEECLHRTPFHLAALTELRSLQPGSTLCEPINQLTPGHICNFKFQDLLNLYGFDLQLAPDAAAVYLTLYWESLARMSRVYAVNSRATIENSGGKKSRDTAWFIGANRRPTQSLKIGEAVADTVRVALPESAGPFTLSLSVSSRWESVYSGHRNIFRLSCCGPDGCRGRVASLGPFERSEIPVANSDLFDDKWHGTDHYLLYNLERDPGEKHDLVQAEPDIFEQLRSELLAVVQTRQQQLNAAERLHTKEELRRLRGIGYVR